MYNNEFKKLERILQKGTIETEEEFNLFLSLHEEAYYANPNDTSLRTFRIHLENGLCEMTAPYVIEETTNEKLGFSGYMWNGTPIRIYFFDQMELQYDSYYDLKWAKPVDEAVLYNYKLVGRVCTVRQLRSMSLDFFIWTRPGYNREFLREKKIILNTYTIDGELKVLYAYFRILDDCDVEQDSFEELSQVKIEITNTKLVKRGSYEHLIQAS